MSNDEALADAIELVNEIMHALLEEKPEFAAAISGVFLTLACEKMGITREAFLQESDTVRGEVAAERRRKLN